MGSCPLFVFQGRFTAQTERLERLRAVASRVAGSYGLEIFDVQLRRESIGTVLRVIIDRPDRGGRSGRKMRWASRSVSGSVRI